jgi:nucleoside-diphosphate-sugar epimerase
MAEYDPAKNFIENAALPAYLAYRAKQAGVPRFIYSSSCSLYGFAADELYDEHSPTTCAYPYGVSKFQGEQGVMQFQGDGFSTIALRLGTACGYSPRPRFDLIVNTMFKCALQDGAIVINNPDIWRPIVDVRDVSAGFALAIEADEGLNGIFNIAYGNYTVKQVGEQVQARVQHLTGRDVALTIHQNIDFRNYRVTCDKAKKVLGFDPRHNVDSIVDRLYEHLDEYGDFSDDALYNIRVFKKLTW